MTCTVSLMMSRLSAVFLENNPVDLFGVVLNATQLDHQLPMALQMCQLGLNTVILVNMIDEADQLGVRIDAHALTRDLKRPVVLLSARIGTGFNETRETPDHGPAEF